ncbi:MAG: Wadjet anti-phage system protein JetD domain-containing protein [Chthoniobacter sp.]|uniref:Wadjet anti-phage system protein JetD domain-containing protein n=1 Tax=Chthoniobacter sp. TaxID=2510640 RepID=UPI0032AE13CC
MSPAVRLLAEKYRARRVGRSAAAVRDLIVAFNDLLKEAGCLHGLARVEAEREFSDLEKRDCVTLERATRDASAILKVRLSPSAERAFFECLGEPGPNAERSSLAELFDKAADRNVPAVFAERWRSFSLECAETARGGGSLAPCFDRANAPQAAQILDALPSLLAWNGESFRRFASAVIFGNSKTLELLQPRIEACLARLGVGGLHDLGIRENPRSITLHGPLTLVLADGALDLAPLREPVRIGAADLRAARLNTSATRCVTVENAAMLHELAKLQSGVLLASSGSEGGFAHSALIDFLRALPGAIELHHFGDSDPAGFDILRDLRERSGLEITSLHMHHRAARMPVPLSADDAKIIRRLLASPHLIESELSEIKRIEISDDKGAFEQEDLGQPSPAWPFYPPPPPD